VGGRALSGSSPSPPLDPRRLESGEARRWLHAGGQARAAGRYEEALSCYDQALAHRPEHPQTLAHRGETRRLAGHLDAALADFDRALALAESAWALAHRGAVHRMRGDYRLAMADVSRALELRPDYPWALGYRCLLHELLGDFAACLRDFDRVVARCPELFPDRFSERATLLCQLARHDDARHWASLAVARDPDRRLALYTRAVVETRATGSAPAAPHIEAARAAWSAEPPDRPLTLYRFAGLFALEGRLERALDQLALAVGRNHAMREYARLDPAWRGLAGKPVLTARFTSLTNA